MKKFILYIILFVFSFSYAQELNLPVATQYLADNDFVVSPTFAGIGDNFRIRANGFTQWMGIENAPENQALYADFRISNKSALGLSLYNDRNGNTVQKGAKLSFAHHIVLDYKTRQYLSFGISYNLNTFRIDIENFRGNEDNPMVDPSIVDNRAISNHNFDAGLLYRFDNYFLSFNANNFLDKKIDNFTGIEPSKLLNYQIYTGVLIKNKYQKQEFEPSIFYQMYNSDKRSTTDINLKYRRYNRAEEDYFWVGGSYRFLTDDGFKPLSVGPMVGFRKSKIYFAYAYQMPFSDLSGFSTGSHMVTIGLDFLQGISNCPCTESLNARN